MVAVFVLAVGLLITVVALAFNVQAGVRSYVGAEGMWSKGQKDAVYFINRYIHSQNPTDYQSFLRAIAVPLGDRKARLELLKDDFDPAIARQGLIEGGNEPDDTASMIFLFRHFHSVSFMAKAIHIWGEGETYAMQLKDCGEQLHSLIGSRRLDATRARELQERINQINAGVTPLEQQFSAALGEGARAIQAFLPALILATTVLLMIFCLLVAWRISKHLRASIVGLRDGAMRVARGDLGHVIPVRSRDELGDLTTVFNDMVTRRNEVEVALKSANDFRERVMESATNAIYTIDLEGRFSSANRRTGEVTGYAIEELIGMPWAKVVRADVLPEIQRGFVNTLEGREPMINREIPLIRKDGSEVIITFSIAPLRRDGVIFGVVGAADDITLRKHAETQLQTRAAELARSNRELEQFAYVASHDLQEPLRTVSGFAQLLARRYSGKLGPEADEYIGFVTTGVQRMKSLIEDLLAYSRFTREQAELKPVELERCMADALANLHGAITATGATVQHMQLPTLHGDSSQLTQLLQNLIGNALKFRREAALLITVSATAEEGQWHFIVRDNGIGIDSESCERIFGLFQRLHTLDKYPGNGIGLTICKKIVDLHHGRIWALPNEVGAHGSSFHFTLPSGV